MHVDGGLGIHGGLGIQTTCPSRTQGCYELRLAARGTATTKKIPVQRTPAQGLLAPPQHPKKFSMYASYGPNDSTTVLKIVSISTMHQLRNKEEERSRRPAGWQAQVHKHIPQTEDHGK